ncbi:MAG: hypothetical protein ACE37F_07935 [Nannocystaceae bacterium]|nr:hypothetical protein [bacterium]
MTVPALASVLQHPLQGVVRIEVDHVRARRFRLLFLVEVAVAIALSLIVIPLLVLLAIFGDGNDIPTPSFESLGERMWVRWKETRVSLVDVRGQAIASASTRVESQEEGARLLGQVLAYAHHGRVALVERVNGGAVSALWFGGQPLMLGPEAIDEARAWRVLQHEGVELHDDGRGTCAITLRKAPAGRLGSLLGFVLLFPLAVWTDHGRERLAGLWASVQGQTTTVCFEVDAHGVSYRKRRGTDELDRARIDRADLLGVVHAVELSPAPAVAVRGPYLRLQTTESAVVLDIECNADIGRALRDAIVAAAHRLWAGLSQTGAPAHCPYCATLYPYAPGVNCPNCGAAPSALHGLASR